MTSRARPRAALRLIFAVVAAVPTLAPLALTAACAPSTGADRADEREDVGSMTGPGTTGPGMMGPGMMDPEMMGPGMMDPEMMGPGMMREMRAIHGLLAAHARIERTVDDIPGGVRTATTSADPAVAAQIRAHVHQMKARLERGQPIRRMDPLFREIFRHHDEIRLSIEDIPGGVRVTETSDNPQVVLLIRQHARRAVSEFVERGMDRAMEPTPLPPGYEAGR